MRSFNYLSVFILVATLLVVGCGEDYQYKKAKKATTIEKYEVFIKQYPESKYIVELKDSLEVLYYRQAKETNIIEAYESFIEKYPDSRFRDEALEKVEELVFNKAKEKKSINALNAYLRKYPAGKFSGKAKEEIKQIIKAYKGKWFVEIFETIRADSVDRYGGSRKHASNEHKLLILGIEVKPPKEGDGLKFREIQVSGDSSESYPIIAIDCQREAIGVDYTWHRFLLIEDAKNPQKMVNRMFFKNQDKWAYLYQNGIAKGIGYMEDGELPVGVFESDISFFSGKPTKIYFLFEIPVNANNLYLQVGKNLRLPISFAN